VVSLPVEQMLQVPEVAAVVQVVLDLQEVLTH
jgi:hypothetical protein